jgi:very-short-patch-repair endonuclease
MSREEQLLIATNIEKHYTCRIIKSDNAPFTLFCSADIGKILGMVNINKRLSTQRFNYDDRVLVKSTTGGGEQNMLYVTYNGLLKIFSSTRKTELIDFSEKVGIDVKNKFYSCVEADTINCLLKSFSGEEMVEQYIVCLNDYRIDLYFPEYKIAVECDENHHKTMTNKIKDLKRQSDLKELLNCIFIRYDPFCENFNIYDIINKIFIEIMKCKSYESKKKTIELNIIYEKEKNTRMNLETKILEEEIKLQQEQLRLQQDEIHLKMQENAKLENTIIPPEPQNEIIESQEPQEEVNYIKNREHTRSPKVYQYDPKTLELIQIYDSIITVTRHFSSSSGSALREAARNNRTYKEFRWLMVDRNTTEVPVPPPTVECRTQSIEFIAMIDIKKTKILEVFPSQKEAAMSRNLAGFSTISRAIKEERVSSGHYWNIFDRCSQEMRDEYLKTNVLPEYHVKANGITVIQINPMTNENMKTYKSITEVLKNFQMSRITLNKVSDNNEIHNGFKWKIVKE